MNGREQALISFYISVGWKNLKRKKIMSNMNERLLQMFAQKKDTLLFLWTEEQRTKL